MADDALQQAARDIVRRKNLSQAINEFAKIFLRVPRRAEAPDATMREAARMAEKGSEKK